MRYPVYQQGPGAGIVVKTALLSFLMLVSLLVPYKLLGGMINMGNIERTHELFVMTCTIALEAEGESYRGKLGVAYVIVNEAGKRKTSIVVEVFRPYRFSVWNTKGGRQRHLDKISSLVWFDSERAAHSAYYGIEKDPTHGADHYLNVGLTRKLRGGSLPTWLIAMKRTVKIGLHTFYKEVR
ncbi:hypothetical protein LCGC14_2936660 [marine sediment metagenome]|uniref:Cell wall hydrolase SleB domain-containing protein n=1 Tax=marine sediment metagenome TaxID=412755 RepID=A0A0F8ZRX9_9ZZZZ